MGDLATVSAMWLEMAAAEQLKELGEKLGSELPSSDEALSKLLEQAAECLKGIKQSPGSSVMETIQSCLKAFARKELLKHQDEDVKLLLAACFCDILRIYAPESPCDDDVLMNIFSLIVGTLTGLAHVNSHSFGRRVSILKIVDHFRVYVLMIDLECDDLITDIFRTFLEIVSENHEPNVVKPMQSIMSGIIDESDDVNESLLHVLLSALGQRKTGICVYSRELACSVIEQSAAKLTPYIKKFLKSSLAGDSSSSNGLIDHHEVIFDVYQCAPNAVKVVVPYITEELRVQSIFGLLTWTGRTSTLSDCAIQNNNLAHNAYHVEMRSKSVGLLGELFSLPGVPILESFKSLFTEFLKRLTDRVVAIRVSVIEHLKKCLMSNHSRPEAQQILRALCDRLLDDEEHVRKQVVAAVCDVACHAFSAVTVETIKLVGKCVRDKSLTVKYYTMERLADVYKLYCLRDSDSSTNSDNLDWILGKILRCLHDKDFRPESIESVLCCSLFPPEFPTKERVKHWVSAVTYFDKVEMNALEQCFLQKQRLQQKMLKYMSLRQINQKDAPDLQKRMLECFRSISRLFSDATKAEEYLNMLHQLKDVDFWKIFTSLLDCSTTFNKAWTIRVDLLNLLGEKHELYDFVSKLSVRCSYLLVNREFVEEIFSEASEQRSAGNTKHVSSCMNLLMAISSFFPSVYHDISAASEDYESRSGNEMVDCEMTDEQGGNDCDTIAHISPMKVIGSRVKRKRVKSPAKKPSKVKARRVGESKDDVVSVRIVGLASTTKSTSPIRPAASTDPNANLWKRIESLTFAASCKLELAAFLAKPEQDTFRSFLNYASDNTFNTWVFEYFANKNGRNGGAPGVLST